MPRHAVPGRYGAGRAHRALAEDQGYDAIHLREQGLQRLPDRDIFAKARAEGRVIVTFDLDFAAIAALSGDRGPAVLLLRLHNTRFDNVRKQIADCLDEVAHDLGAGAVATVEEARIRLRRMPVGE